MLNQPSTAGRDEALSELVAKCSFLESSLSVVQSENELLRKKLKELPAAQIIDSEQQRQSHDASTGARFSARAQMRVSSTQVTSYLDEPSSDFSERHNNRYELI